MRISAILLSLAFCLPARADLTEFLHAFHANPAKEMDRLPEAINAQGKTVSRGYIDWRAVEAKWAAREEARKHVVARGPGISTVALEDAAEAAEQLVDGGVERDLRKLQQRGLRHARSRQMPWADSYWPMYRGLIADRYADPEYPKSLDWLANHTYVAARSAAVIGAEGVEQKIDLLSPAEKYDLAVGDEEFSLTAFSWAKGKKYFDRSGKVADWMGICHGWAGASHMQASIPSEPVKITSARGQTITFHPQDIKALQSMLWANAAPPTRFLGHRCKEKSPEKDAAGRVVDPACFDVNPATWHLVATHQMGIHRRSFVMDSVFDWEVWNFPVSSYRYRYFNPQTSRETRRFSRAIVPVAHFTIDPFKSYRSPTAKFVVGVAMDVTYVVETEANREQPPSPPTETVRYVYDLELDEEKRVIGGEWYTNAHPDFLWTFAPDAEAQTEQDPTLSAWAVNEAVPAEWSAPARAAAQKGSPLSSFVRRLHSPSQD